MRSDVSGIKAGSIVPRDASRIVKQTRATALIDGGNGLGQVVARKAMEIAIRKARATAVGFAATASARMLPDQAVRIFAMVLCSQFAVGAFNDYCDADLDARVKPTKPIAAGLVSRAMALVITLSGMSITVVLAAGFGPATVALAVCGVVMTSSPAPIPSARSASTIASVPLATPTVLCS